MPNMPTDLRIAYFKRGNVADELQRIGPIPTSVPKGGQDHYIATFLNWASGRPVLVMSYSQRNAFLCIGNVTAREFKLAAPNGLAKIISHISIFFKPLFHLLRFKPDWILCAASGTPLWACYIVSKVYNIPIVHTRHTSLDENKKGWLKILIGKLNDWVLRHMSAVMCHTGFVEQQLLKVGVKPDRLFQFNLSYKYLLDQHLDQYEIRGFSADSPYTYIIFVGRMHRHKGIFDLFEAMRNRLMKDPSLRLIYIGDGPDLEELKRRVSNHAMEEHVIIPGQVDHHYLPNIIKRCTLAVTPTYRILPEARCKSAVEALVLGKPVIAPDYGPFAYLIKDGVNGLLFKPESIPDLQNKIELALSNNELYEKLRKGAIESGNALLNSARTFREALDQSFKLSTAQ